MTDAFDDDDNPIKALSEIPGAADLIIPPPQAISALAIQFALKWHDMRIIKDGTLYQAKKAEGVNFNLIDLPDVLETAQLFEAWLLSAPNRQAEILKSDLIERFSILIADVAIAALENGADAPDEDQ